MEVGVVTPQKYLGNVIGDLNSRNGQVAGMAELDGKQVIIAFVPVANLFGCIFTLKHMTRGGATCTMAFSHYEQVPPALGPGDDTFPPAIGMRA
jgi:elongation factor G